MTPPGPAPSRTCDALDKARCALSAAISDQSDVDLSWIQPPPTSDGWTLAPDALRFVARLVRHLRPQHVLEFGAGLSTRMLARTVREADLECAISSVDHDPEFGVLSSQVVQEAGPKVRLAHQLAPVVARECGGKLLPIYLLDAGRFASPRSVDLVIIDGPPITLGGREGTLYQLLDYLHPGTLVLLDDADRRSECNALAHWKDNLGGAVEVLRPPGFSKGLAVILVHESLHSDELWQRKLDLTYRQIADTVPADARFILVDQDYWAGIWPGRQQPMHFVERAGESWGPPVDDATAVFELEQRRLEGSGHLVIVWPAFWWCDYYAGLISYVRAQYPCLADNDRVVIFDLAHERSKT